MSSNRIRLTPIEGSTPEREVYIGWDRGLQTYFAQVFDGVDSTGEDVISLDLGNEPRELATAADAVEAVRAYAEIPEDLASSLADQQAGPGALAPSPFLPPSWDGFDR
ncbi:hypothetical protein ACIGO9_36625 [Nocardia asteroides]|uniref:hypothetical protein n=1 Tax=Nocardia asteroides TaxID=1824 RepID=UPI0037CB3706